MAEVLLLIFGVSAFVFLANTIASWVLPASSLGEWPKEEKEKGKENRWWSIN
jgi:hypothetical protein